MEMGPVVATFLTQLRELLGLPKQSSAKAQIMPFRRGQANLRDWERDFLFR